MFSPLAFQKNKNRSLNKNRGLFLLISELFFTVYVIE